MNRNRINHIKDIVCRRFEKNEDHGVMQPARSFTTTVESATRKKINSKTIDHKNESHEDEYNYDESDTSGP
ncbi:hypothetical protein MAR_031659 [Mya arenaria]|uniref:Uncharacterized protein n=1 Tax=Mya arenaria TaxID=6604 RepID=A0ABY7F5G2_MYAAR|nr:hypothetical protein MAR_031659 [Mya arenaria]